MEFESEQDRDYYVNGDQAHAAFTEFIKDKVTDVQVIDFTTGVYKIRS